MEFIILYKSDFLDLCYLLSLDDAGHLEWFHVMYHPTISLFCAVYCTSWQYCTDILKWAVGMKLAHGYNMGFQPQSVFVGVVDEATLGRFTVETPVCTSIHALHHHMPPVLTSLCTSLLSNIIYCTVEACLYYIACTGLPESV